MDNIDSVYTEYYDAIYDTDRKKAHEVVNNALEDGVSPEDIVFKIVIPTIENILSELLSTEEVTLSQHYICSKVSSEIVDILLPRFIEKNNSKGTVVIGTSKGDFHGLGKKIVTGCLIANMYDVVDIGINAPAEKFVEKALETGALIIGVSSMMVHSACGEEGSREIRRILDKKKLSDKIKLIVGGAPFNFDPNLYKDVGADAWAENGLDAVRKIDELLKMVTP